MAAGAAPAPEKALGTKDESAGTPQTEPATLKERILHRLHEIFKGREEYLGWRQ